MRNFAERSAQAIRQVRRRFNASTSAVRLATVGSVVGAAFTYPILIAAKLAEIMPPHFTWLKLAIILGALWGMLLLPLAMETFKQRKKDA